MSASVYEKYNVASSGFNEDVFIEGIGTRLKEAGFTDVARELIQIGSERQFLAEPLSPQELRAINSTEALAVAEEAAIFAARVNTIDIRESGERMVHLPSLALRSGYSWSFSEIPYHPACGEWAGKPREFWVREGFAAHIEEISRDLGLMAIGLHFEDAFRPVGVQEGLFARRYQMAKDEHPEWGHEEVLLEAKSKTAYSARLASHKGGAAVDVRAVDLRTGDVVDIGHEYPDGGAHVALHSPLTTQRQWENRMLLASMVNRNGVKMFPFEDWHACMGDNTAAACEQSDVLPAAVYGPVKQFDKNTGEILEVYSGKELDEVFSS